MNLLIESPLSFVKETLITSAKRMILLANAGE